VAAVVAATDARPILGTRARARQVRFPQTFLTRSSQHLAPHLTTTAKSPTVDAASPIPAAETPYKESVNSFFFTRRAGGGGDSSSLLLLRFL